ncbi:ABC transporter substrate-binding protein [Nodularia spumigena]|uniref:ABC transporter substrate-binding protein n=1 Tax=Nodularia spumigena TaxID=70799 RepID=UPI0030D82027
MVLIEKNRSIFFYHESVQSLYDQLFRLFCHPVRLIYYNNAIALQGNSPFSLAVVVPADSKTETAQEMLRGVAQAQNEFNNQKGLKGRLLEIVITNDDNKPEKAKQVAQELVQDSSILGVIGHNSSNATQAALPEYKPARLAVVSPTSTSCFLNNEVFLRTVYSDANAGEKLAKYASNNLKLKKVVIFGNPKSEYSNTSREVFTREFEKLGGEVVRKPLIDLTDVNFDKYSEVNKIKDEVEAAILFPDTENTDIAIDIAIANEKSNTNLENQPEQALKFLGGDTLYSIDTINKGGKAVEGMIVSVPWFRETSKAEKFAEKSKQQWRRNVSWRTATSYDATQAFIKALSLSSNPSRTTVLKNLKNVTLSPDETSGYGFKFTEEREREGEPVLLEVKDGKFTYLL